MSHDPELRTDPISGRTSIIAPARSARPSSLAAATEDPAAPCPFCPGNENLTPTEVLRLPGDRSDDAKWAVRVIPNLYPATVASNRSAGLHDLDDLLTQRPNTGRHEVVVETNEHTTCFTDLQPSQAEQVFLAYARRFRDWQSTSELKFGLAFKNSGPAAGATVEHTHSQLIGLTFVPDTFQSEWNGAHDYFARHQRCVFCDVIKTERRHAVRIVDACSDFVVVCPFASRLPYEMCILPVSHTSHFDQTSDARIMAAGRKTHEMLTRLTRCIDNVPYNFLIHTAPFTSSKNDGYHWHVEIIPRIAKLAGFEWGSGCHLNPVSPEQAAKQLRTI